MNLRSRGAAHAAVFSANIIFALNYSVVKFVTPGLLRPFGLNVARVLLTTALLYLLRFFGPAGRRLDRADRLRVVLCGLTGVAVNQLLFIKGLSMTYSTHGALLMLSTPVVITFVSVFLRRERLSAIRLAGLCIGISGAALLILGGPRTGTGGDVMLGNTLILLNAVSYSFYFVLVKPLMEKYTPIQVVRWVFLVGSLFIIPVGWGEFASARWADFGVREWAAIGFVVLGATFLAYLLNIYALRQLDPASTGAYIYMQPLIAAVVAALFLDEPFTAVKGLSALLIFSGVWLVNRRT